MKKLIPVIVAVAIGLVGAVVLFGVGPSIADNAGGKPKKEKKEAAAHATPASTDGEGAPKEGPNWDQLRNPPPPGTLRPTNKAEQEQMAREQRPFNQHYNRVSGMWGLAVRLLTPIDPALAKECEEMSVYLRMSARKNSEEINIDEIIRKEMALEQKIRESGLASKAPGLQEILDYINSSASTVLQNGDPAAIPRPDLSKYNIPGVGKDQ